MAITSAVDAPAFSGFQVISQGAVGRHPAGLIDFEHPVAVDGDGASPEGGIIVHLDGTLVDGHRTSEISAGAADKELRIAPLEEAAHTRAAVVHTGDGKAFAQTRTLVEAFDRPTAALLEGVDDHATGTREVSRTRDHHLAHAIGFVAEVAGDESRAIRGIQAEVADDDRTVIRTWIDIEAGAVLHEERAEGILGRQHRGRVGIEPQHGDILRAAIHAGHPTQSIIIRAAPDGDATGTSRPKLIEVQAALVEGPIGGQARPRPAGRVGLVLENFQNTRAELDDLSGGNIAVELVRLVVRRVNIRIARAGGAELKVRPDVGVTPQNKATHVTRIPRGRFLQGDGIELT